MVKHEQVSLDDMDWFEFQRFVAHLFEKLGFGKCESILKGNDFGRDVTLRSLNKGLTVIECKHHPKGSIGRPVVQKLHSAVITANGDRGYVVTTGRFSENATKYSKYLKPEIRLVDLRVLADMAKRAGIKLLKRGEKTAVFHVLPPSQRIIEEKMLYQFIGCVKSHPLTPIQLSSTEILTTKLIPAYLLEYSLHQNFRTSVGLVNSIHVNNGQLLIHAVDGSLIKPQLSRLVTRESMVDGNCLDKYTNVSSESFKIGYSTAKRKGLTHIQNYHTENVGYYGRNNVHYTKRCKPNVSNIFIKNFTQVYIPFLNINFKTLDKSRSFSMCGNQKSIEIIEGTIGLCEFCGNKFGEKRLLCNSCGSLVHGPKFFRGHSYFCEKCRKTICKECTYWTRKYLFFKRKLCEECADMLHKTGKKVKKMIPKSEMTSFEFNL